MSRIKGIRETLLHLNLKKEELLARTPSLQPSAPPAPRHKASKADGLQRPRRQPPCPRARHRPGGRGGRPATSGTASAPSPLREPSAAPHPGTTTPAPPQPLRRSGRSCPGWPGPARRAPPAAPPRRRTPACGRQNLSGCRGTTPPRLGRRFSPAPSPLRSHAQRRRHLGAARPGRPSGCTAHSAPLSPPSGRNSGSRAVAAGLVRGAGLCWSPAAASGTRLIGSRSRLRGFTKGKSSSPAW